MNFYKEPLALLTSYHPIKACTIHKAINAQYAYMNRLQSWCHTRVEHYMSSSSCAFEKDSIVALQEPTALVQLSSDSKTAQWHHLSLRKLLFPSLAQQMTCLCWFPNMGLRGCRSDDWLPQEREGDSTWQHMVRLITKIFDMSANKSVELTRVLRGIRYILSAYAWIMTHSTMMMTRTTTDSGAVVRFK